jgi:hypothetical protein
MSVMGGFQSFAVTRADVVFAPKADFSVAEER